MTENEKQTNDMLHEIMNDIKKKLPEGMGFTLLAYEFGDKKDRRMLYASNSKREDVMMAMLEFVDKNLNSPEIYGKDV